MSEVLVIIAFFFNGSIGVGTLINAFITGIVIQWIRPYVFSFKQRNYSKSVKVS
ncbi:hypothetical protein [Gracilibacillus boraciitolerans]|uniref:hypothetical protein n=1 Tax=Gracilibacillus boraciitolerans TaxID=307521 RepID=UPI001F33C48E|nr:hypothetical protein [Gracilibacillus boraciitolerans]